MKSAIRAAFGLALAIGLATGLAGCDERPTINENEVVIDDTDDGLGARLVSLSPAITQMILDLDKGDLLVGVGQHDAAAPEGVRVVGGFDDLDAEAMLAVRPTMVLIMATDTPASLKEMGQQQGFQVVTYPYPEDVNDVGMILFDEAELVQGLGVNLPPKEGPPSLGTLLGRQADAQRIKIEMLTRMGRLQRLAEGRTSPKVLMAFSVEPTLTAVGPDQVLDAMLRYAGGFNAAGEDAVGAPQYDREKLLSAAPESIILLMPGAAPLTSVETDPRLSLLRGLDIPAVRRGRIGLIRDPHALLPTTSIPRVTGAMMKLLYPDLGEAIDRALDEPVTLDASTREALLQDLGPRNTPRPSESPIETPLPEDPAASPLPDDPAESPLPEIPATSPPDEQPTPQPSFDTDAPPDRSVPDARHAPPSMRTFTLQPGALPADAA